MTLALTDARRIFNHLDNLGRAGVKIRIAHILRTDPALDMDSVFILAVSREHNQEPLP